MSILTACCRIHHKSLMPRKLGKFGKAGKTETGPATNFSMTKNQTGTGLQSVYYKIITTYFSGRAAILKSSFFQPFRGTYAFAHTLYNAPP